MRPCLGATLYVADEVFMTGTAAEITPVRQVDRRGQRPPGRADAQSPEALWRRRARPDRVHALHADPLRGLERLRSAGDLFDRLPQRVLCEDVDDPLRQRLP